MLGDDVEPLVVEGSILAFANAPSNSGYVLKVTRRSADPSSKKAVLVHKLTFEAQEGVKSCMNGENFATQLGPSEVLHFEMKKKGGVFKREKFSMSLPADSLQDLKQANFSKWYELRQLHQSGKSGGGSNIDFRSKSGGWKLKTSSPSTAPPGATTSSASLSVSGDLKGIPSLTAVSVLLSLSRRMPQDTSALRRSKSSSGSEGATIAQRRRLIIQAPIDDHPLSNDVIVALYSGSQLRDRSRRWSATFESSNNSSSSGSRDKTPDLRHSNEGTPRPEPVYITFSDEEDEPQQHSEINVSAENIPRNNWNSEYQELLEIFAGICNRGSQTRHDTRVVSLELAKLEADFLQNAETYGKIILSELFIPNEKKTIKPVSVGGYLGGQKFVVEQANIMFKVPDASPFLSEKRDFSAAMACAMKVAGHELAGIRLLSSYFFDNRSTVRVSLPLACVIDYVGMRLLAMSILPISSHTLKYGSQNAGGKERRVVQSDETLTTLLNEMGQALNLEAHRVVDNETKKEVTLRTPVDLEGHRGFDNRFYLVDTSRLMPPCVLDTSDRARIFFELFRPEAMQYLPALSPDALSIFVSTATAESEKLRVTQEQDIFLSAKHLLSELLSESVAKLIESIDQCQHMIESFDLVAELHSFGLNVRFLGLVVAKVGKSCPLLLEWLYCESLSRVVKNRIRSVLRVQLKQLSGARSNLTEVVAKNLEAIFCFPFDDAWKEGNKWIVSDLMDSFRFSAEDANLCVEFLHKPHVQLFLKPLRSEKAFVETPISYVLGLVCKSLAISIQPSVMEAIRSNARQFDSRLQSIAYMDISLSTRVKHLPLIERCSAFILSQQGIAAQTITSAKSAYLKRAHEAISGSLRSCPNDAPLLLLEGEILARELSLMRMQLKSGETSSLAVIQAVQSRCITAFERAVLHDSTNTAAMMRLASIYSDFGNHKRAEELFINALEVDSCDLDALKRYGDFLSSVGMLSDAEPFYLRRQKIMTAQQTVYQSFRDSQMKPPEE